MSRLTFLCELPPPFGGVTVKNQLIIDKLFDGLLPNIIDFCAIKRNPLYVFPTAFKMIASFVKRDTIVCGLGTSSRVYIALKMLKILGGLKCLNKTVIFIMGGDFQDDLKNNKKLLDLMKKVKVNLVETERMRRSFINCGLENTDVFPNPKPSVNSRIPVDRVGVLKCVFMSRICTGKGVDYIINEFDKPDNSNYELYFYGPIDNEIKDRFLAFVESHKNVFYNGIFDSAKDDVYAELSQYDVLLFPTTWQGEGVPGVLIEAKMAGIVPIVSDWKYNSEIVINNVEGIVLIDLSPGTLRKAVSDVANDRELLKELKNGSYESRVRYSIETYKNKVLQFIK